MAIHGVECPWSTDDPWVMIQIAIYCTGAHVIGLEPLDDQSLAEIQAWLRYQQIYPRADGRMVRFEPPTAKAPHWAVFVDNLPAIVVPIDKWLDPSSTPYWWDVILQAVFKPEHLDYAFYGRSFTASTLNDRIMGK